MDGEPHALAPGQAPRWQKHHSDAGSGRPAFSICKGRQGATQLSGIGTCNPPSPPGPPNSCLGTCGTDLAACAQGVTSQLKTCVTGCRSASDHLACLEACGTAAKQGAATCASDFQTCQANCASSPSGAFVD